MMHPTKRRGRPRLDPTDPSVQVSVYLTAKQYDAMYARARVARMSVSEFIREQVQARPPAGTSKSQPAK